jgi:hypothetical protein
MIQDQIFLKTIEKQSGHFCDIFEFCGFDNFNYYRTMTNSPRALFQIYNNSLIIFNPSAKQKVVVTILRG